MRMLVPCTCRDRSVKVLLIVLDVDDMCFQTINLRFCFGYLTFMPMPIIVPLCLGMVGENVLAPYSRWILAQVFNPLFFSKWQLLFNISWTSWLVLDIKVRDYVDLRALCSVVGCNEPSEMF